jgi:Helix-turn-helix.
MTTFEEFHAQVVAEAEAEGPEAVAELRMYETRYRLASDLIGCRQALHMTQQQLAAASGIRQSEISRIESGRPWTPRSRPSARWRAPWAPSCA